MTPGDAAPAPTLAELGETGLLARIIPALAQGDAVQVGPGDDAAVVRLASPRLVISTDTMTEGEDFLREATRPVWIGRKSAVQNLADIAAMGARPSAVVIALSCPETTPAADVEAIMAGLAERCGRWGASVVGGDLGRADVISLTVTAVGSLLEHQDPVTRSGARPGDVIAVASELLGRSAAGLAAILSGHADDPDLAPWVAWHDAPDPDLALGWTAGRTAHAMLDVSDGLLRDAGRLARASHVLIDLDPAALAADARALEPAAAALGAVTGTRIEAMQWVLTSGEEHALLAAFPPDAVPAGFRVIGSVCEGDGTVRVGGLDVHGPTGFDHFGA